MNSNEPEHVQFSLRLPRRIYEWLTGIAIRNHRTRGAEIRRVLEAEQTREEGGEK
jgi:predicted DNA-binding protein